MYQCGPGFEFRNEDVLVVRVRTAAHRAEPVERRRANAGGEVAVRRAADRHAGQRRLPELLGEVGGAREQCLGRFPLQRRAIRATADLEMRAVKDRPQRPHRCVHPFLLGDIA